MAEELTVTLPDGTTKTLPAGTTGLDLAASIGRRLAKDAVAVDVDGRLTDLTAPLPDHATVEVEFKKPVFLPGKVAFGSRVVEDGLDFSLTSPGSGAPHLVGRARRA